MKRAELLEQVGTKIMGWEFLRETPTDAELNAGRTRAITGSLPNPPNALWEALEGKRGPIFWCCGDPNEKLLFYVAEPGHSEAFLWDPLENVDQLRRAVAEAEPRTGSLTFDDGMTPREICEALLEALSEQSQA